MVEISEERLKELEKLENKYGKTKETKLERIDTSTVGGRIKYYRTKRGLTQKELGNRCSVVQSYVNDLENNNKGKNLDMALTVVNALEVSFKDIYPNEYEEIIKTDSAGKQNQSINDK